MTQSDELSIMIRSCLVRQLQKLAIERAEFYVRQLSVICQILPCEEKQRFMADPMEFISATLWFRGMTAKKMADFLRNRCMQPEEGQMGSVAVFETDSPYLALTFESGMYPALAVIDKSRAVTLNPVVSSGAELSEIVKEKMTHPPVNADPRNYAYLVYNEIDTMSNAVPGHSWHSVELRLPQPITEVVCFIVGRENRAPAVLDPSNPRDRQKLELLYLKRSVATA